MKRRKMLKNMAVAPVLLGGTMTGMNSCVAQKEEEKEIFSLKGNINHSFCRWCYQGIPLEELADYAKELGVKSIELLREEEWAVVQSRGLTCAIATGDISLTEGFNTVKNHAKLQQFYPDLIRKAAAAGLPNVICFSGNRNGIGEEEGLENCAIGLEPLIKLAEKEGITLIMELFNSKIDHPDYQADSTFWGVNLVEKIGSNRFKLLYDIYHMQIMEGDIIRTIKDNYAHIGHYHTAGVPGRNEINDDQELFYPAIMKAIVETGYTGFVGQEFIPTRDNKLESLKEGILICDV